MRPQLHVFVLILLFATSALAQTGPVSIYDIGVTLDAVCGIANMDDDTPEEIVVFNGADVFVVDSSTGEIQFTSQDYAWFGARVPGYNGRSSSVGGFNAGFDPFVDIDGDGQQELVLLAAVINGLTYSLAIVDIGPGGVTTVSDITPRPALQQNQPNPFNPTTRIRFEMAEPGPVTMRVFDIRGMEVRTLLRKSMPAGNHTVTWDGTDDQGRGLASGTYFYTLETRAGTTSRKALLLK